MVPRHLLGRAVAHVRGALPNEGCGLLAEAFLAGTWRATAFFPGDNVERSPHRFTMDPLAVVGALREIDARGWRLAAIVHSHPTGPATPSPTDLAEAYYPDAALLIVGLGSPVPEVRAWRLGPNGHTVMEVAVVEVDERVPRAASPGAPA